MAISSLLDEPAVREQMARFSVKQYHQMNEMGLVDKNTELLEGVIVQKMAKSPRHEFFAAALAKMLEDALPPGYIVRKEAPISGRDSEPEPDIALVRGALIDFLDIHPATAELVVEIALFSAEIDYRKRNIYSWADVEEY